MARKRMIDPDFWTDEKILELSIHARFFFIGTWNFADDEGYIDAGAKKLKALIFPYDFTIAEVAGFLQELIKFGFIKHEGNLIKIVNFEKHQYIKKKLQTIKEKREKFRKAQTIPNNSSPNEVEVKGSRSEVKGKEIKNNTTAQKDCAEPEPEKALALTQNQAIVASIAQVYKTQTGQDFKAGREDFVIAADLIKKHGAEAVGVKCVLLAHLCNSRAAWFTRDGWADFSVKKLSAHWNSILPGTGATKEQIDDAKAKIKVEEHNALRSQILQR